MSLQNKPESAKVCWHRLKKGTANPSLGVLGKITSGLRIEFQELISVPPMESCLVDLAHVSPVKDVPEQYRVWNIFPFEDNRLIELYRIEIEPGGVYVSGGHGEKTREYIAVLEGEMHIETAGEVHKIVKTRCSVLKRTRRIFIITKVIKPYPQSVCFSIITECDCKKRQKIKNRNTAYRITDRRYFFVK